MSLSEIFCQDRAISILQSGYACGKSAHAYIFAGLEGVGKFKTAREWAKLLLCEKPVTKKNFTDSCGQCRSCTHFDSDSHPDYHHVYKELREFTEQGKGKTIPLLLPVDVIREFLVDKISARPTLSRRVVFIVSETEKANASSQNAMLKSLEEPPEYCTIILLCTRLEKLLPTTKSRCRIIRFSPINEAKIIEKLKQMDLEQGQALYFGRLAAGSLGHAYKLAKLESQKAAIYETKKKLITTLADLQYADTLDVAAQFQNESKRIAEIWAKNEQAVSKADISRRAAKLLVQIIISALYDAMRLDLIRDGKIINFDQQQQIKKIAGRFNLELCSQKIADCYETIRWIEASVNEKLVFEQLLLNLAASDTISV